MPANPPLSVYQKAIADIAALVSAGLSTRGIGMNQDVLADRAVELAVKIYNRCKVLAE